MLKVSHDKIKKLSELIKGHTHRHTLKFTFRRFCGQIKPKKGIQIEKWNEKKRN